MKSTFIYKEMGTYTLKGDFYKTNRENAPVIVYIHGGGLIWGSRKDLSKELIQLYTENGFAVFSIDYRLAPETKLHEILKDLQDAFRWIKVEGPNYFSINPQKIACIGGSAGAFLALNTGTFEEKPNVIVSFYGYGDISAQWALAPSKHYCQKDIVPKQIAETLISNDTITEGSIEDRFLLYLYARQSGDWIQLITGVNPNSKEQLTNFSPQKNVNEDFPPTLLLHGTNDKDVPYEQSVFMRAALLNKGVETKLITIPNGEHVFEKDYNNPIVQHSLKHVIDFLHTHLS